MAQGKTASQSGLHLSYGTADKAVDGNTNPSMDAESCIHAGKLPKSRNMQYAVADLRGHQGRAPLLGV